ncbi:putative Porin domain superfamily, eukaryotic porin/Tom40 [Helianthus anomalus]
MRARSSFHVCANATSAPLSRIIPFHQVSARFSNTLEANSTLRAFAQHALDPLTTVKARIDNLGKANALIQHEWRPKSLFTISGEVDTKAVDKDTTHA